MKEQKLVITGMGAVTPIGIGVDAYWSALVEGQCGVGKITRFDASELPVQIAGRAEGLRSRCLHAENAGPHDGPVHAVCLCCGRGGSQGQ